MSAFAEKLHVVVARGGEMIVGAVRRYPVELLCALVAFVLCVIVYRTHSVPSDRMLAYAAMMPVAFFLALTLNKLILRGLWRVLYWAVLLGVAILGWFDLSAWVGTAGYKVALGISLVALFVGERLRDNRAFVSRLLAYVQSGGKALLVGALIGGSLSAIFGSMCYIFGLPDSLMNDLLVYSWMVCGLLVVPVVFLSCQSDAADGWFDNLFFDRVVHYILSPAVLIYTGLLYLYFIRIVWTLTLPRGGVAWMVFLFTMVAMGVGSLQYVMGRRPYDWFYRRFSLVSLPALAMFWIGVSYRIRMYALTEERVYLLLCGAIMTVAIGLFFSRRVGRYLYVAVIAVLLLACFTYIPGLTASQLGLRSQTARAERLIRDLGLGDARGHIVLQQQSLADTVHQESYRQLYEALRYLRTHSENPELLQQTFGIRTLAELNERVFPLPISDLSEDVHAQRVYMDRGALTTDSISIEGYGRLYDVNNSTDRMTLHYATTYDSLHVITSRGDTLLARSWRQIRAAQLQSSPYPLGAELPRQWVLAHPERFLTYRADSVLVIFTDRTVQCQSADGDRGTVGALLLK